MSINSLRSKVIICYEQLGIYRQSTSLLCVNIYCAAILSIALTEIVLSIWEISP